MGGVCDILALDLYGRGHVCNVILSPKRRISRLVFSHARNTR